MLLKKRDLLTEACCISVASLFVNAFQQNFNQIISKTVKVATHNRSTRVLLKIGTALMTVPDLFRLTVHTNSETS